MKKTVVISVFLLSIVSLFSQSNTEEGDKTVAKDNFQNGDWKKAMEEYEGLIITDSTNAKYYYRLGICYLETFMNKEKAIHYLNKAVEYKSDEKDVLFMLGKAYHQNMKFDKATAIYKSAVENSSDKDMINRANRYIEMVENAKQLTKYPLKGIKIENLGEDVNSPEPDYTPFIDEDETTLFFNSKRSKGNSGYMMLDGLYTIDIFMCKEKRGEWTKARNIGGAVGNTADDEIVGMSHDGSVLFTNLLTIDIHGDILRADAKGRTYEKPSLLPPPINSEYRDFSAGITPDQQIIYFSSERPGGFGGYDIYKSKLLPNGEWGDPENLGPTINTEWDEIYPHIASTGKAFFFASEGHSSIGGFDIFKCVWDDTKNQWGKPKNLGYPINTCFDDFKIALSKNERVGYIASHRDDAIGDLDIYSVTFEDVEDRNSAIRGSLTYLAPIDYNDYEEFHMYKKGDVTKRFIKEFLPPDKSWEFVEIKRSIAKPGMIYRVSLIYEKDGVEKTYSLEKAPKDDPTFLFKDIKIQQYPDPDYKPTRSTSKPTQTQVIVKDALLTVNTLSTGDLIGQYLPSPNSGKYIIIVPPGSYTLNIEAEGFKNYSETFHVVGKGSFEDEVMKNINLVPLKEPAPIHYSEIKQGI